MTDCNHILQQLNDHFDGVARLNLEALRRQAAADPDCLTMFDALVQVHALFESAPMVVSSRDFAASVTSELAWRRRKQRWALAGVVALGALTLLLPILTLIWAGAVVLFQPSLVSQLISNALGLLSDIATYAVALLTALQHLPAGLTLGLMTILSLSLLLLALASANRFHPELLTPSHNKRSTLQAA